MSILNHFRHNEQTFVVNEDHTNDSRNITAIGSDKVLLVIGHSNNFSDANGEPLGNLNIKRDHKSQNVEWRFFKGDYENVVHQGNLTTRNKSTVDLDWHYLDLQDAEEAVFKAMLDAGTIKV